jgi:adenylyltransferase/sulfurtransferase
VLVVGLGALGCPATLALARAPLERLTLVDPDRIEHSNLQRQVLFTDGDIGALKVETAATRLAGSVPRIEALATRLDATNAAQLIAGHDFVIDACDDPQTKFLINAVALAAGRPFSYGGVTRTGGLAMAVVPGKTACLACVFPEAPAAGLVERTADASGGGCQQQGIVAPVAGVIGFVQALHALGALGHAEAERPGRLLAYDLHGVRWRVIEARRDPACAVCSASPRAAHHQRRVESCRS